MDIRSLARNWNDLGKTDPFESILWPPIRMKWDEKDFFDTGQREIKEVMQYISRFRALSPDGKALDFGCGVGRLTQPLAAYFHHVTGLDISASMIDQARKRNRYPDRCMYVINDQEDLQQFHSEEFSFIYSNMVLQHMDPVYSKTYIREFVRILRRDGILLFQLPEKLPLPEKKLLERAKNVLRKYLPSGLLETYYRIRDIKIEQAIIDRPERIEMHGIPKTEIIQLLEGQNAKIADIVWERNEARPQWLNYKYCVVKQ